MHQLHYPPEITCDEKESRRLAENHSPPGEPPPESPPPEEPPPESPLLEEEELELELEPDDTELAFPDDPSSDPLPDVDSAFGGSTFGGSTLGGSGGGGSGSG